MSVCAGRKRLRARPPSLAIEVASLQRRETHHCLLTVTLRCLDTARKEEKHSACIQNIQGEETRAEIAKVEKVSIVGSKTWSEIWGSKAAERMDAPEEPRTDLVVREANRSSSPVPLYRNGFVVYICTSHETQKHFLHQIIIMHGTCDEKLSLQYYMMTFTQQLNGLPCLFHSRPQHINHMLAYPPQSPVSIVHRILCPSKQ